MKVLKIIGAILVGLGGLVVLIHVIGVAGRDCHGDACLTSNE
jgi:hypothetical protein